jgi:hypothetical protein
MKTFATNDNYDIYLGRDGNLAMVTDLEAVKQTCEHVSRTILGELPYAQSRGIPFKQLSLDATSDTGLYDMYLRKVLMTVQGVTGVGNVSFQADGDNLKYSAEIKTIYETEKVSGNL